MVKIYARDCNIMQLTNYDEETFLNEYHIQGYANSIISYGLLYNEELVQLMSFGKPRFNDNYQWEIIRDCTKTGVEVNGGTSKLWKYFLEENNPIDVICYSYPHNGEYTNKYVDYCGFKNVKKAKPEKKIYFEGNWNGNNKRINKSILERHGVDRLLKGSFGHDRTNEQILLDLGFKKKEEDGYAPQVDSWFRGGCVYMMEVIGTNKFYIGKTICDLDTYWGSGTAWNKYLDDNEIPRDDEHIKKTILANSDFKSHRELYDKEYEFIQEYCYEKDGKLHKKPEFEDSLLNENLNDQWIGNFTTCPECGTKRARHKKTCSRYKPYKPCEECGALLGHRKSCSKYKEPSKCSECGAIVGHKSTCSKFVPHSKCLECGSTGRHKKTCSKSRWHENICSECGSKNGLHKLTCSRFNKDNICPECGSTASHHKSTCSRYKKRNGCPECGSLTSHKPTCSHYKPSSVCPECGGKRGHHNKDCSKFKSHYKCSKCGVIGGHKEDCLYNPNNKCPECGRIIVNHKITCSHYIQPKCPECGGLNNTHRSNCSHFVRKEVTACPECGGKKGHFKTCSHYNRKPCSECGVASGPHLPGCSKFKESKVCPECGGKRGHHRAGCSKHRSNCQRKS